MNRTIPIAGALAAALGSMVAFAPAQAADATCTFGIAEATCVEGWTTKLGDKTFKIVSAPSSGAGKVDWSFGPVGDTTYWQTDIDWDDPLGLEGPAAGNFKYTVDIDPGPAQFASMELDWGGAGPSVVTKEVFDPEGNLLATLDSEHTFAAIDGKSIVVNDSWRVPENATLDNVINTTTQKVPGPLPVLGAVAALGMSRRLRRRLADANA